ncbi:MAG: LLM class flavin-dependent oxidoreductase [Rhodospirillaceae bacterium]|nr:LLM class flavin-dependent oxidoreductase [Rhodospirillaceae bacterium]
MHQVHFYCWHFMAYPYLPADFDDKYESGWVTVPNSLWDHERADTLYQGYIDQLVYAEELGFDGLVLNEHHQNIYGLMPSPNLIAAALTQRTERAKLVILGNILPLHLNPLRVAEEYAMLDNMSDGRLIAGFAIGGGPEAFNYDVPQPQARRQFWEAVDLVARSWVEDGPFRHEGRYYPLRYVNLWPRPRQKPHPPIWIPGALSLETMDEVAKRGYDFFLSSRRHDAATQMAVERFADRVEAHGGAFHPYRMGILLSVYVGESDEQARAESRQGVWYFLRNCVKGHLRSRGRNLTFGPGVPSASVTSWETYLERADPTTNNFGDVETWEELDSWSSVIVGSPETVRKRLWRMIESFKLGTILIQFHFGNLPDDLTRKSMKLFATEVAPKLRSDSGALFAEEFPALGEMLTRPGAAA